MCTLYTFHVFSDLYNWNIVEQDTERIATGCQDGLMRVYQTCKPEQAPTEYKAGASGSAESITKVAWMPDPNLVVVSQRAGKVSLFDVRTASAPVKVVAIAKNGGDVMDLEVNPAHNTIVTACEQRVIFLSVSDLTVVREYQMPSPMHFKEEGGASLSSDGRKFLAVCTVLYCLPCYSTR